MAKITNDSELRAMIAGLGAQSQRTLGARFANSVAGYTQNKQLLAAIEAAMEPDLADDDKEQAYKNAKSISVKTYTACGRDADWLLQAEHFVAAAATAALAPVAEQGGTNPAWKAAMQARMAQNCAMMETADDKVDNEAKRQYEIAEEFGG